MLRFSQKPKTPLKQKIQNDFSSINLFFLFSKGNFYHSSPLNSKINFNGNNRHDYKNNNYHDNTFIIQSKTPSMVIIRSYSQAKGSTREIRKLMKQLSQIKSISDFSTAQDLLQQGLHVGIEPQLFYYEHLIAKSPDYGTAKHLFYQLIEKHGLEPTGRTLGVLAQKLLAFHQYQEIFDIYSRYRNQVLVGSPLFTATQRAVREIKHIQAARMLWNDFQQRPALHNHGAVWVLFVDMFAHLHRFEEAEDCLAKMLKLKDNNTGEQNSFELKESEKNEYDEAEDDDNFELKEEEDEEEEHREKSLKPETKTVAFTTLMSNHLSYGNIDRVFELHEQMKQHRVLPLQHTYTVLFSACGKKNDVYRAQKIFHDFLSNGLPANKIILNAYLGVVATADYRASVKLIEYFKENFNIHPNSRSLTIILANMPDINQEKRKAQENNKSNAQINPSILSESKSVFDLIDQYKELLYKDSRIFLAALKAAGKRKNSKLLAELYHRLLDFLLNFPINEAIIVTSLKYVSVVRNLRTAERIYAAVNEKWGLEYTIRMHNAFLTAVTSMAREWRNVRYGFHILRKYSPNVKEDVTTLNIRLKAMGRFERYRDMFHLFQQRKDEGFLLNEITFNSIILAYARQGNLEGALNQTREMLAYEEYLGTIQKQNDDDLSEKEKKLKSQLLDTPNRKVIEPSSHTLDILLNSVRNDSNMTLEIYKKFKTEFNIEPSWHVRQRLEKQLGNKLNELI